MEGHLRKGRGYKRLNEHRVQPLKISPVTTKIIFLTRYDKVILEKIKNEKMHNTNKK